MNEADTRAKLIDPALHKIGWTEDLIRREITAGTIEIINGKTKRKKGRTDYILCLPVKERENPLSIGVLEAKNEGEHADNIELLRELWVNPNVKEKVIPKPEELIKIIEDSQIKINEGLRKLKEIS